MNINTIDCEINNNDDTNNTINNDSLQLDLLNLNIDDQEECMICRNPLNCEQCYVLPECNHKYHTNCIISWFRNGDSRCPYCGNKGINNTPQNNTYNTYNRYNRYNFSNNILNNVDYLLNDSKKYINDDCSILNDIRKYAFSKKNENNKNAIVLKKKFLKLQVIENNCKNADNELENFNKKLKKETVIFGDAQKTIIQLLTYKIDNIYYF